MEVDSEEVSERVAAWLGVFLLLVVIVGAISLARRNLRQGRGDKKGALRLGTYVFVVTILFWVLRIDHVAAFEELGLLFWAVSASLFLAGFVWVAYIALEPYIRRIWPETLVSWSRLMAGSFKDPLVGRDILYGGVAGVLVALSVVLSKVVPSWLGLPLGTPSRTDMAAFSGIGQALGLLANLQFGAVISPMFVILLILVFRVLFRRHWLAVSLAFLVFASMQLLQTASPSASSWIFLILVWVIAIVVITRFGLLPSILMFYFAEILIGFHLPSDFSIWYAARFAFVQLLMVGVVVYGFWRALAGQRLLGEDLF